MHGRNRAEYKSRLNNPTVAAGLARKAETWHTLSDRLLAVPIPDRRHAGGQKQQRPVGSLQYCESSEGDEEAGKRARASDPPQQNYRVNDKDSLSEEEQEQEQQQQKLSWSVSTRDMQLKLTEKLLTVNPDPGHLWNRRRDILLLNLDESQLPLYFRVEDEISLTSECLRRNPKAYGAWFHRKWVLRHYVRSVLIKWGHEGCNGFGGEGGAGEEDKGHIKFENERNDYNLSATEEFGTRKRKDDNVALSEGKQKKECDSGDVQAAISVVRSELGLCGDFLTMDGRNFHCWNYRRFVVSALACILMSNSTDIANPVIDNRPISEKIRDSLLACDGSWKWAEAFLLPPTTMPKTALLSGSTKELCGDGMCSLMGAQLAHRHEHEHGSEHDHHLAAVFYRAKKSLLEVLRSEWDFTEVKIMENFSNCSAFHYRSKLLPIVLHSRLLERRNGEDNNVNGGETEDYEVLLVLAREELEMVRQAIYTEPDDQTPWWYHRFVISWAAAPPIPMPWLTTPSRSEGEHNRDAYLALLEVEAESVRELIDAEEGRCKWGLLALHMIVTRQISLLSLGGGNECDIFLEEIKLVGEECLEKLVEIDPDRNLRYRSMRGA